MKRIVVFSFALFCFRGFGQQIPSQIQAKRGVFTDRLFLNGKWINHISTNLFTDSASDNVLLTASGIRPLTGSFIQNQSSVAQPASFRLTGKAVIGSYNSFKNTLASGYPATAYVTHGNAQYGVSIQRASQDQGPADIVMYRNYGFDFRSPSPPGFGDGLEKISFSGIAGDNNTVVSPVNLTGFIERAEPAYTSSGFIFNTIDSNGATRETDLNAQGHLMLGYVPTNPMLNQYTLNVASGDVRFKSLSGNGDVLAGSDNNGVLNKIIPGKGLLIQDSTLLVIQPQGQGANYLIYSAVLDEYQQSNPQPYVSESNIPGNIVWTRDSVGHYTATSSSPIFNAPFTWLHSHPSDPSGNVGATRLYRTSATTLKLVVKDNNLNDTDVWQRITIEMRVFIQG